MCSLENSGGQLRGANEEHSFIASLIVCPWFAQRPKNVRGRSSWADALPMIHEQHPTVVAQIVDHLEGVLESPCLGSASRAAACLDGVHGWEVLSWSALAAGLRPEVREPEAHEPAVLDRVGSTKRPVGWKKSLERRCSPICHPAVKRCSRHRVVP